MKTRDSVLVVAALMALVACRGEQATVTGAYGAGVVVGKVAVTGLNNNSPAGVQVWVRGTGMTTTLAEDGAFTFAEVPENAVLVFHRADGIDSTLELQKSTGFVEVTLSPVGASQSSGKRRAARSAPAVYEFEGLVRSAGAAQLVVFTSHQEEVTFTLDAGTVIRKGDQPVNAADLAEGARVHVKATKNADVYTATLVIVQDEEEDNGGGNEREAKEYEGLVRSASATKLVIFDAHGEEVTFVLDAQTVIRKGNAPFAAGDLKVDDRVHVKATVAAGGTKTATEVIVQNTKKR
jgi:hypothetical protein